MDTGASDSIFPSQIIENLSLPLSDEYQVILGATGIGFSQYSETPIRIELEDYNGNKIENTINPLFITKIIPKAQIDFNLIEKEKDIKLPFSNDEINDLEIEFSKIDNFSAQVNSLRYPKSFPKRFFIKKYTANESGLVRSSEILLGRDFQKIFIITYQETLVKIQYNRRKGKY